MFAVLHSGFEGLKYDFEIVFCSVSSNVESWHINVNKFNVTSFIQYRFAILVYVGISDKYSFFK